MFTFPLKDLCYFSLDELFELDVVFPNEIDQLFKIQILIIVLVLSSFKYLRHPEVNKSLLGLWKAIVFYLTLEILFNDLIAFIFFEEVIQTLVEVFTE